ncbi:MAG: 50S ribosomal protein L25 [Desulfotalea sp.]
MYQVEMSASVREVSGKGPMRRLRQEGLTPAVVYGGGKDVQKLQMDSKILMTQLLEFYKVNTVVNLKVEGQDERNVLIGEVQVNPITDALIHVDFCEVDLEKEREFKVPVAIDGVAKGVDLGGNQEVYIESLMIKAKAMNVPNEIRIDVSDLAIGDQITVADIVVEGVEIVSPGKKVAVEVLG